jgi:antitoxin VapB
MPPVVLSIKSAEADRLARQLARETGESITDAVTRALRERLERCAHSDPGVLERLQAISEVGRALPRLDQRTAADILGYDADGLPS